MLTSSQTLTSVSRQLTSVIGELPVSATDAEFTWTLNTVRRQKEGPKLILNSPKNGDENIFVEGIETGIYEVGFWVDRDQRGGSEMTPYGKIVWIPQK